MNSYERFESICNKKKPDKMPFYFPTIACTVASEILGRQVDSGGDSIHFKEELVLLDGENAHREFVEKYREDAIELNRKLKADVVRQTWRSSEKPTKKIDEYTLLFEKPNGTYKIKRFFPEYQSYGTVEDTTQAKDTDELVKDLKTRMKLIPTISDEKLEITYKDHLDFQKMAKPYFPTMVGAASLVIPMYDVVWLEASILEPEVLSEYFMYQAIIHVQHIKWLAKKGFKWINGGGDLASSRGPVYSPQTFSDVLAKPYKLIIDECKRNSMIYCFRTDGNLWGLLDCMVNKMGLQALGEVDREASMEVGKIKNKYPGLIVLGNVNSSTLCKGTVDDVRHETRASLVESGGYNYVPGPSNAVVHGTPPENVYAMIDEIDKFQP